jgi:hypothetical protein
MARETNATRRLPGRGFEKSLEPRQRLTPGAAIAVGFGASLQALDADHDRALVALRLELDFNRRR